MLRHHYVPRLLQLSCRHQIHRLKSTSGFRFSELSIAESTQPQSGSFDGPAFPTKRKKSKKFAKPARRSGKQVRLDDDSLLKRERKQKQENLVRKLRVLAGPDLSPGAQAFSPKVPGVRQDVPGSFTKPSQAPPATKHRRRKTLTYTRRTDGLLEPLNRPVLQDVEPVSEHKPVATLSHGLGRVLFNPGVHWLQDPRSRVYNFTPWLEQIPKVEDFAFERLPGFIKSSRDQDLWKLAEQRERTFVGSTSSLSGMLSHIYFLISGDREVNTSTLSMEFQGEAKNFTPGQRMPKTVVFQHKDGVYAIDSAADQPGMSERNILTWMGTLLEKFLTSPSEEFKTFLRRVSGSGAEWKEDDLREAYRYSESKRFVMRSQLDCQDSRLPGTGVFDIKTRAALPIRADLWNHEENSGYLIRSQHGIFESFEREYYDLIRSAFLKYSFQVRIGDMDGVMVAYHNTARMFGFQYISLEEMESCLYGSNRSGDGVFEKCVRLMEAVSDEIILCFPGQTVNCTFETLEKSNKMSVWVTPEMWGGEPDEHPVVELEVTVTNFIGGTEVLPTQAISEHIEPEAGSWSLLYSISRSAAPLEEIKSNFAAARARQVHAWKLPTGVSLQEMARVWANCNYASPGKAVSTEENTSFNPERFTKPPQHILALRKMARQGRLDTKKREEEEKGNPKIIFGDPDSVQIPVEGVDVVSEPDPAALLQEATLSHEDLTSPEPAAGRSST